jgi:hypothetical protein
LANVTKKIKVNKHIFVIPLCSGVRGKAEKTFGVIMEYGIWFGMCVRDTEMLRVTEQFAVFVQIVMNRDSIGRISGSLTAKIGMPDICLQ